MNFPPILPWKTVSKKTRLELGTKQDFLICGAERTAKPSRGCCIYFQFVLLSVYLWVCVHTHTRVWFKAHSNHSCSLLWSHLAKAFLFFILFLWKPDFKNIINNSTTTCEEKHTQAWMPAHVTSVREGIYLPSTPNILPSSQPVPEMVSPGDCGSWQQHEVAPTAGRRCRRERKNPESI